MPSILIISCAPIPKSNILSPHTRNALLLADYLKCDIISEKRDIPAIWKKNYDVILISYSTFYTDFKHLLQVINKNSGAKLFYMTNEYNIAINGSFYKPLKERGFTIIANFVESAAGTKIYSEFKMVDINVLLYTPLERKMEKTFNAPIYYGTFRADRGAYFKKYLQKEFILSTSAKNIKKFMDAGVDCKYINKLKWDRGKETLSLFKYGLYIEDEFTHSHYNYLGNRFYEMLMCNVVQFFDKSCHNTLIKSGLGIEKDFIVNGYDDLMDAINQSQNGWREAYLKEQQTWRKGLLAKKSEVLDELRRILIS